MAGRGDPVIEREEIYEHETHGCVRVLGIWRGVQSIDEAGNVDDAEVPMIVCYTTDGDDSVGELTDTVDGFLNSVKPTD